jgi:hypothetical protein
LQYGLQESAASEKKVGKSLPVLTIERSVVNDFLRILGSFYCCCQAKIGNMVRPAK